MGLKDDPHCSFAHARPLIGALPDALAGWTDTACDVGLYTGGAAIIELLVPENATVFAVTV